MSGIAGIARSRKRPDVDRMLDTIRHRGPAGRAILDSDSDNVTMGVVWPVPQSDSETDLLEHKMARDSSGKERFAEARAMNGGIAMTRDSLGAAPLYAGMTEDHIFCFASEVKALLEVSRQVIEVPPGVMLDLQHFNPSPPQMPKTLLSEPPDRIAAELLSWLDQAVKNSITNGTVGCWLSGGLDSSVICALLRPYVKTLHSFSVGMKGSPDLTFARQVADTLQTEHHELVVNQDKLLQIMTEAVHCLESFDAFLVRSSLMNYLVGKLASEYVAQVFSGEASDELFAGYDYLKTTETSRLPDELLDIQARLHNTAFQRVDRCSAGHGLIAHLPFAIPEVVQYARRIPPDLLIKDGSSKWILRYALRGKLPDEVLWRDKSKFWQGSGINDLLARMANDSIADIQYEKEKSLPNGWILRSKEELMYYRAFKERFGELRDLNWMGRTKETNETPPKRVCGGTGSEN